MQQPVKTAQLDPHAVKEISRGTREEHMDCMHEQNTFDITLLHRRGCTGQSLTLIPPSQFVCLPEIVHWPLAVIIMVEHQVLLY